MAEFAMGARASCSDGFCGEVRRTILDPAARTITHLVVQPGHHNAEGRLVPIELADATGGEISLRCTLAEFERLEPAEGVGLAGGMGYGGGYRPGEAGPGDGDGCRIGDGGVGLRDGGRRV